MADRDETEIDTAKNDKGARKRLRNDSQSDGELDYEQMSDKDALSQQPSKYKIERVNTTESTKYSMLETTYKVTFSEDKHGERLHEMMDDIHDMFTELLEKTEGYTNEDKARVTISHANLDVPIHIHCQPKHQITADTILQRLVKKFLSFFLLTLLLYIIFRKIDFLTFFFF